MEKSRERPLAQASPPPTPIPSGTAPTFGSRPQRLGPHDPTPTQTWATLHLPQRSQGCRERAGCGRETAVWVTACGVTKCGVTPEGDVLSNIPFQAQRDPEGHLARSRSTMGRSPPVGPQTSSTGASHCRGLPEPTHHPDKGHLSRSWPLGPWPCRKLCCLPVPPKLGGARLPLCPSSPQNFSHEATPRPDTEAVGRTIKGPLTPPCGGACPALGPKDPLVQAGPQTATPGSSPLLPGVLCRCPRGTPASPAAGSPSRPGLKPPASTSNPTH